MSYDIGLRNADGSAVEFDGTHQLAGGTYAMGGTSEAWLNVTYNYSPHFYRTMGEKGIRAIYGMTARDSAPLLAKAIAQLKDDRHSDYWKPTEGNARAALQNLLTMATMAPDGIWEGD